MFCLLFRISDDTGQNFRHILQICDDIVHIDALGGLQASDHGMQLVVGLLVAKICVGMR